MDRREGTGARRSERPARRLLRAALGAVGLAGALGVTAWCIGRLCSDRYGWSQWLLWIPTPAAIGFALLGLLAAARPEPPGRTLRRRRLATWTAIVVAATVYLGLVDGRLLRAGGPAPSPGLSVVHWNMTAKRATPRSELAAAVIGQDADLTVLTNPPVLLGEDAWRDWTSGRTLRSVTPFVVVSRLPLLQLRPLVASDGVHVVLVEIDAAAVLGRSLVLWLVDLPSEPRLPRMEIAERTRRLLVDVAEPDLIVGDFNMTRGSAALRRLAPRHRDAFDLAGGGLGGTYPRRWPFFHIDHTLVAPGFPVDRYTLIDPGAGEHRIQRTDIAARDAAR